MGVCAEQQMAKGQSGLNQELEKLVERVESRASKWEECRGLRHQRDVCQGGCSLRIWILVRARGRQIEQRAMGASEKGAKTREKKEIKKKPSNRRKNEGRSLLENRRRAGHLDGEGREEGRGRRKRRVDQGSSDGVSSGGQVSMKKREPDRDSSMGDGVSCRGSAMASWPKLGWRSETRQGGSRAATSN